MGRGAHGWDDPARGTIRWHTLLSKGLTPSKDLVCGVAELAVGDTFASHCHAQSEVYFGLEGVGIVMIDGEPFSLCPGAALFIPPDALHGIPTVTEALRYFYVFAADSFDDIAYRFSHEIPPT